MSRRLPSPVGKCLTPVPDDPARPGYRDGVCLLPKGHDGAHGNISWARTPTRTPTRPTKWSRWLELNADEASAIAAGQVPSQVADRAGALAAMDQPEDRQEVYGYLAHRVCPEDDA